jgi:hypothetical protein
MIRLTKGKLNSELYSAKMMINFQKIEKNNNSTLLDINPH